MRTADIACTPDTTLLAHLTGAFAATIGRGGLRHAEDHVRRLVLGEPGRCDLKKWKITLTELENIIALTAGAQLLDFLTLPLDATEPIASLDRFLRTSRLLRLRDSLPETEITLLEVLEKLNAGAYATAADLRRRRGTPE